MENDKNSGQESQEKASNFIHEIIDKDLLDGKNDKRCSDVFRQ